VVNTLNARWAGCRVATTDFGDAYSVFCFQPKALPH
jgi:hypothetical protein